MRAHTITIKRNIGYANLATSTKTENPKKQHVTTEEHDKLNTDSNPASGLNLDPKAVRQS